MLMLFGLFVEFEYGVVFLFLLLCLLFIYLFKIGDIHKSSLKQKTKKQTKNKKPNFNCTLCLFVVVFCCFLKSNIVLFFVLIMDNVLLFRFIHSLFRILYFNMYVTW